METNKVYPLQQQTVRAHQLNMYFPFVATLFTVDVVLHPLALPTEFK